jgi:hypothetical protein
VSQKTHRRSAGKTAGGIPISQEIAPSRKPLNPSLPARTSLLGGKTYPPRHGGMGLNDERPSFERLSDES